MTRAIYLLGAPGSGKSTVMRELLRGWSRGPYIRFTKRELFGHQLLSDDLERGVYLGHLRPEYPGTDALSLSVMPHAITWAHCLDRSLDLVLGEGQRLGSVKFFKALSDRASLRVGYLDAPEEVLAERRAQRPGKSLSDRFVKTASSAARGTALKCSQEYIPVMWLDATQPPEDLASRLLG